MIGIVRGSVPPPRNVGRPRRKRRIRRQALNCIKVASVVEVWLRVLVETADRSCEDVADVGGGAAGIVVPVCERVDLEDVREGAERHTECSDSEFSALESKRSCLSDESSKQRPGRCAPVPWFNGPAACVAPVGMLAPAGADQEARCAQYVDRRVDLSIDGPPAFVGLPASRLLVARRRNICGAR